MIEGSVRTAGERIRITAQLVDGPSGYHLWSQNFDRRAEDLFELQDELASAIIMQTLNMTLHGPDQRHLLRGPPTRSLEAYQLYLEARPAIHSEGGLRMAFDKLQVALRLDPRFAAARAATVYVRSLALQWGVSLPGTLAEAEHEVRQDLERAPDSAATHRALAIIRAAQGRWLEAEASFRQALALDDTDPATRTLHSAYVLDSVGHLRAGLSSSREAHRIAPAWPPAHICLVVDHVLNGNDDEARAHAQAAIELGVQRTWRMLADCLSFAELRVSRHDAACALMQGACMATMKVSQKIEAVDRVFSALAGTTDRAVAVAALDGLRADAGESMRPRLMMWYSMLGAYDQAYEVMNRWLDDFAATDTIGVGWGFLWLRELAGFREDPRFGALAERMRLPEYWERYGPPDGYDWRDGRLVAR